MSSPVAASVAVAALSSASTALSAAATNSLRATMRQRLVDGDPAAEEYYEKERARRKHFRESRKKRAAEGEEWAQLSLKRQKKMCDKAREVARAHFEKTKAAAPTDDTAPNSADRNAQAELDRIKQKRKSRQMPNEYHAERMRQKRAALKRDAEGGSADALEAIQRARELNARRQKEMRAQKRLEVSQRYADLQHRTEAGDDGAKGALELMEREREELKEKWQPAPFRGYPGTRRGPLDRSTVHN